MKIMNETKWRRAVVHFKDHKICKSRSGIIQFIWNFHPKPWAGAVWPEAFYSSVTYWKENKQTSNFYMLNTFGLQQQAINTTSV